MKQDFEKLFEKGQRAAKKRKEQEALQRALTEEARQKRLTEEKARLESELGLATRAMIHVLKTSDRIRMALFRMMEQSELISVKMPLLSDCGGFALMSERIEEETWTLAICIEGNRKLSVLSKLSNVMAHRRSRKAAEYSRFFFENMKVTAVKQKCDRIWGVSWIPLTYHHELPEKIKNELGGMADPKKGAQYVAYTLPLFFSKMHP